jgi:hypothetical protein
MSATINQTVMLSIKYILAGSRTYPGPQGVQASLVLGAGDNHWYGPFGILPAIWAISLECFSCLV